MKDQKSPIGVFIEKAEAYVIARVKLYQLKVIEKSADIISTFITHAAIVLLFSFIFIILNIGVALWIGELMEKSYYGFFTVSGFYLLIGMMLYIFRNKWIKVQVANSFIAQALKHVIVKRSDAGNLLKQLVEEKEIEYKVAENLLKENLHLSYENLKPTNIIKNAFNEIIHSPDLKTNLINTIIGYTSGILTKKAFTGNSRNVFKNLSGIIIEKIVANGVMKNADRIKTNGRTIIRKIINRFHNPERV